MSNKETTFEDFYGSLDLLRLERTNDKDKNKLFNRIVGKCLKNCYPDIKKEKINSYKNKVFFVLVDKSDERSKQYLKPYGFFTVKLQTEKGINSLVLYDLCKAFKGSDNDMICRIMLHKFIEHLEKENYLFDDIKKNQHIVHEIVLYVNTTNKGTLSCYKKSGFETIGNVVFLGESKEKFEEFKLNLAPKELLEHNNLPDNITSENKKLINSQANNIQELKPAIIAQSTKKANADLGEVVDQIETIRSQNTLLNKNTAINSNEGNINIEPPSNVSENKPIETPSVNVPPVVNKVNTIPSTPLNSPVNSPVNVNVSQPNNQPKSVIPSVEDLDNLIDDGEELKQNEVAREMDNGFSNVVENAPNASQPENKGVVNAVTEGITGTADNVSKDILGNNNSTNTRPSIGEGASMAATAVSETAQGAVNSASQALSNTGQAISNTAGNITQQASNAISGATETATDAISSTASTATDGATEAMESATETMSQTANSIGESISNGVKQFTDSINIFNTPTDETAASANTETIQQPQQPIVGGRKYKKSSRKKQPSRKKKNSKKKKATKKKATKKKKSSRKK